MNKYNLKIGMILYCKNGETVKLASFSDTHIRVIYKGKIHERPITVLNEKLFFVKSCEKIILADSSQTQKKIVTELPNTLISPINSKENISTADVLQTPIKQEENVWKKSCRNCRFQVSGECSSWELCDDYQPVYSPPKSETDYWPKYGDATMFKKKGRRK